MTQLQRNLRLKLHRLDQTPQSPGARYANLEGVLLAELRAQHLWLAGTHHSLRSLDHLCIDTTTDRDSTLEGFTADDQHFRAFFPGLGAFSGDHCSQVRLREIFFRF